MIKKNFLSKVSALFMALALVLAPILLVAKNSTRAYADDDFGYVSVGELWDSSNTTFNQANVQDFMNKLAGSATDVSYQHSVFSSTNNGADDLRSRSQSAYYNKDIKVSLGGLVWQVVYIDEGNVTLWLSGSTQLPTFVGPDGNDITGDYGYESERTNGMAYFNPWALYVQEYKMSGDYGNYTLDLGQYWYGNYQTSWVRALLNGGRYAQLYWSDYEYVESERKNTPAYDYKYDYGTDYWYFSTVQVTQASVFTKYTTGALSTYLSSSKDSVSSPHDKYAHTDIGVLCECGEYGITPYDFTGGDTSWSNDKIWIPSADDLYMWGMGESGSDYGIKEQEGAGDVYYYEDYIRLRDYSNYSYGSGTLAKLALRPAIVLDLTKVMEAVGLAPFEEEQSNIVYSCFGGEATITSGRVALSGAVTIPETIYVDLEPYNVVAIANNAFENCSGITSVELSDKIKSIGNNAFKNCSALTSMTFNGEAPSLGTNAFSGTSNQLKIYVPYGEKSNYISNSAWNALSAKIEELPAPPETGVEINLMMLISCGVLILALASVALHKKKKQR